MKRKTGSCINKFFMLIGAVLFCTAAMQSGVFANALGIPDNEYNALVALYNSTNGPNWIHRDNWLSNNPNWYGVTVQNEHVTAIDISVNCLAGSLPAEIGNFTHLQYLYLDGNHLTGAIPPEIGKLVNLQELLLGVNQLTGELPTEIGSMVSLQKLFLNMNQLTGAIPHEIGNLVNLQELFIRENLLTGQIPPEIGNLVNLQFLHLGLNQLTGAIPPEMSHMTNIQCIFLDGNKLTGPIPPAIGNMSNLHGLFLGSNQLSGSIPAEICSMANLQELSLCSNQLTGVIPAEIGNLTNLVYLDIGGNQLSGSIPAEICSMVNLQELLLCSNKLTGVIPAAIGGLTDLRRLLLNGNQLTGEIPSEIGNLKRLQDLNLYSNELSGAIPSTIGNLRSLWNLYLNFNQLNGSIPSQIGNLPNLRNLYLDTNRLSGEIPASITNLTRLDVMSIGFNSLSSSDQSVSSFLTEKEEFWQYSQTVPPTDVSIAVSHNVLTASWTPILYSWEVGYYEVGYSSTPGGPYKFDPLNRTSDKHATSLALNGLDLSKKLYFVVRTVSVPAYNPSTLTSELSPEVVLMPLPQDKLAGDGSTISLQDMVVTATFDGCYYVEKPNRTFGIQVKSNGISPEQGEVVNVTGTLRTNEDGERYVEAISDPIGPPPVLQMARPVVKPLFMINKTLGGGDLSFNSETGAGQRGIDGGAGLNNIGMFVKTTGKVVLAGRDWLYIDDGSGLDDGSGIKGLYVDAKNYPAIPVGSVVWVEGISSCDMYKGRMVNTLRATNGGIISSPPVAASKSTDSGAKEPANPRKQ